MMLMPPNSSSLLFWSCFFPVKSFSRTHQRDVWFVIKYFLMLFKQHIFPFTENILMLTQDVAVRRLKWVLGKVQKRLQKSFSFVHSPRTCRVWQTSNRIQAKLNLLDLKFILAFLHSSDVASHFEQLYEFLRVTTRRLIRWTRLFIFQLFNRYTNF